MTANEIVALLIVIGVSFVLGLALGISENPDRYKLKLRTIELAHEREMRMWTLPALPAPTPPSNKMRTFKQGNET